MKKIIFTIIFLLSFSVIVFVGANHSHADDSEQGYCTDLNACNDGDYATCDYTCYCSQQGACNINAKAACEFDSCKTNDNTYNDSVLYYCEEAGHTNTMTFQQCMDGAGFSPGHGYCKADLSVCTGTTDNNTQTPYYCPNADDPSFETSDACAARNGRECTADASACTCADSNKFFNEACHIKYCDVEGDMNYDPNCQANHDVKICDPSSDKPPCGNTHCDDPSANNYGEEGKCTYDKLCNYSVTVRYQFKGIIYVAVISGSYMYDPAVETCVAPSASSLRSALAGALDTLPYPPPSVGSDGVTINSDQDQCPNIDGNQSYDDFINGGFTRDQNGDCFPPDQNKGKCNLNVSQIPFATPPFANSTYFNNGAVIGGCDIGDPSVATPAFDASGNYIYKWDCVPRGSNTSWASCSAIATCRAEQATSCRPSQGECGPADGQTIAPGAATSGGYWADECNQGVPSVVSGDTMTASDGSTIPIYKWTCTGNTGGFASCSAKYGTCDSGLILCNNACVVDNGNGCEIPVEDADNDANIKGNKGVVHLGSIKVTKIVNAATSGNDQVNGKCTVSWSGWDDSHHPDGTGFDSYDDTTHCTLSNQDDILFNFAPRQVDSAGTHYVQTGVRKDTQYTLSCWEDSTPDQVQTVKGTCRVNTKAGEFN